MNLDKTIDVALDNVLKASGSALKYYTMQLTLDRMRDAMREFYKTAYNKAIEDAESEARKYLEACNAADAVAALELP